MFSTMKYIAAVLLFCLVALISDVNGYIAESNPCNNSPCQNDGRCKPHPHPHPHHNSFICLCTENFTGEICQYDVTTAVRLSPMRQGSNTCKGRLQVFAEEKWSSVCADHVDDSFRKSFGEMACAVYGDTLVSTHKTSKFRRRLPSVGIRCAEKATKITNCEWKKQKCKKQLLVYCQHTTMPANPTNPVVKKTLRQQSMPE